MIQKNPVIERSGWCSIKQSGQEALRVSPTQKIVLGTILANRNTTLIKKAQKTYKTQYESENIGFPILLNECFDFLGEVEHIDENTYRWTSPLIIEGVDTVSSNLLLEIHPDIIQNHSGVFYRLVHALFGGFENGASRTRWFIDPSKGKLSRDNWKEFMEPFAPMWMGKNGGEKLMLSEVNAYKREIGVVPLPGFEENWPDKHNYQGKRPVECPFCEKTFKHIGFHWHSSTICNPAEIGSLRSSLLAMILAGAEIIEAGDGIILKQSHSNKRLLDFLRIELDILSNKVRECDGQYILETNIIYDKTIIEVSERYAYNERTVNPLLAKQNLIDCHLLRLLFALCGEIQSDSVLLKVPEKIAKDPLIQDRLRIYQSEITNKGILLDKTSFFSMVGIVPILGAENKWPTTY